ncbi:hypothetical protein [Massilia sp. TWR1-2-2]|uniref:hypothetical protein n=1 Tax=Massilia sp. TWR1-2-2 TaxID=2804584 RepID=UPI003CE88B74
MSVIDPNDGNENDSAAAVTAHDTASAFEIARTSMKSGAARATRAMASVGTSLGTAITTASSTTRQFGASAADAAAAAARTAGSAISDIGVLAGDLNGDGKVDMDDARIAVNKIKDVASATADEVGKLGKSAMQSDMAKDAAAGALVGAALATAIRIPIVSTSAGALAGAVLGVYKNLGGGRKK